MKQLFFSILVLSLVFGCSSETTVSELGFLVEGAFSPSQRIIADQAISVFENNSTTINYSYAEDLGDGRGITAGRAGFTSANGDMLEVIERYTVIDSDNSLADYVTELTSLAATESDSTAGLSGLETKWAINAKLQSFKNVQDAVVDDYYYDPAVGYANEIGASYPFTLLNLYDASIQHGDGSDLDSLSAMIETTTENLGGTPKSGIDEATWVREFLRVRRAVLLNPDNADTQTEWSESVGRVDALITVYQAGNLFLAPPVIINPWGDRFSLPSS
ncbi:MAG: chitosanase [SAR324 cluster bacterium]|nr:chitosanase [SAR324 cluster bacterium]